MTQCYVLDARKNDGEELHENEYIDGTVYASEVFNDEEGLQERLKDVSLEENANYFILGLDSAEDLLYSIAERLLNRQRLIFATSWTQGFDVKTKKFKAQVNNLVRD